MTGRGDLGVVLFWLFIATLAVASWVGPYVLKKDRSVAGVRRYHRFGYAFAFCFGLLPVLTGDWPWALATIPIAELVMHYWILRPDRSVTGQTRTQEVRLDRIDRSILEHAVEDYTGLWELGPALRKIEPSLSDEQLEVIARERLQVLLRGGLVKLVRGEFLTNNVSEPVEDELMLDDSPFWRDPDHAALQLRIVATERGNREYYGQGKSGRDS